MTDEPQQPSDDAHREGDPKTMPLAGYLADGRICRDLKCCRCGYNLRTLPRDANCPECDLAVLRSLYHLDLRYADPNWLKRISTGLLSATLLPAALLVPFLLLLNSGGSGYASMTPWDVGRLATFFPPWLIGAWSFAMPEPLLAKRSWARRATRATTYLLAGVTVGGLLLPRAVSSGSWALFALVIAIVLNVGAMMAHAIELTKRLHGSLPHADSGRLMKLSVLAFFIAVVGIATGVVANLAGAGVVGRGTALVLLTPITLLIEICFLRLAIQLAKVAAIARRMHQA